MGNPMMMVMNAGYGQTPIPADAILKPGDEIGLHVDGIHTTCRVTAVVPATKNVDYAIADQNGTPRPLVIRETIYPETVYVIDKNGEELLIGHSALSKGKSAADAAGLNP